jgi:hypothetical protein
VSPSRYAVTVRLRRRLRRTSTNGSATPITVRPIPDQKVQYADVNNNAQILVAKPLAALAKVPRSVNSPIVDCG